MVRQPIKAGRTKRQRVHKEEGRGDFQRNTQETKKPMNSAGLNTNTRRKRVVPQHQPLQARSASQWIRKPGNLQTGLHPQREREHVTARDGVESPSFAQRIA